MEYKLIITLFEHGFSYFFDTLLFNYLIHHSVILSWMLILRNKLPDCSVDFLFVIISKSKYTTTDLQLISRYFSLLKKILRSYKEIKNFIKQSMVHSDCHSQISKSIWLFGKIQLKLRNVYIWKRIRFKCLKNWAC